MIIRELKLDHFRNLENNSFKFSEKGHLILGDNAQGKTNLLEAVYFLTLLRSYRSVNDSDCIRFGEKYFSLRGKWQYQDNSQVEMNVSHDGRRKKIILAGEEKKRISEAFGVFKSVIVTPEDISIIQGGPSERRRFIDVVLSIDSTAYLQRLKRYRKALFSRNNLLRDRHASDAEIRPWEDEMAASGAFVICQRLEYIRQITPLFEKLFHRLSESEKATLEYKSSLLGKEQDHDIDEKILNEYFKEKLATTRNREREKGKSLWGPQTDELELWLERKSLRKYGSQGQQRTAIICLKMAQAEQIEKASGEKPVLLLDDVFSELDKRRSGNLLKELVERHQSIITAPKKEALFERLGHLPVKIIEGGVIKDG